MGLIHGGLSSVFDSNAIGADESVEVNRVLIAAASDDWP